MRAHPGEQTVTDAPRWAAICPYRQLEPERGVAALVDGVAVVVFRLFDGSLAAIGNVDPYTGASVLSRGIVGSRGTAPTVASPLHKQAYDLCTGVCLDDPQLRVPVYPVRCRDGLVEVGLVDRTDRGRPA